MRSDGHGLEVGYFTRLTYKNGWKVFNVTLGATFDNLQCVHPDTAKEILKNGKSCCDLSFVIIYILSLMQIPRPISSTTH